MFLIQAFPLKFNLLNCDFSLLTLSSASVYFLPLFPFPFPPLKFPFPSCYTCQHVCLDDRYLWKWGTEAQILPTALYHGEVCFLLPHWARWVCHSTGETLLKCSHWARLSPLIYVTVVSKEFGCGVTDPHDWMLQSKRPWGQSFSRLVGGSLQASIMKMKVVWLLYALFSKYREFLWPSGF